ncbi:glycosyltransferase family 4 protein [Marinifilum sp. RC60d5]|uniref:glycosyltransferase family 4 protein n=1 Tax=Marinifilum sp. RC60d5 TaxID=3458414 RepID=UPI004036BAB4
MRIGIEGQRLYRKKKHGMDMVALELIKNLQLIDKVNEYVIFVKPDEDNTCIPLAPNFKIVELKRVPFPFWEQWLLPKAAHAEGCDILHCTSNTGPIWSSVPLVTTLHDIIYLESLSILKKEGSWYQKLGNLYRRWVVPFVIRKSIKIVTVSNFEKQRIQNFLEVKHDLAMIYNGVSDHFKRISKAEILTEAKNKYKLPDNFLLFLGNTAPKKNTPNVLRAFADLNASNNTDQKLVMLDFEENQLQKILSDIGSPEIRKDILLTGYVVNFDLPAIINQSQLLLYPSLRESFGIPILEGMACGVPVITSNTSSMPEIAGDAALLVNPDDSQEITKAIYKILEDDEYREDLCSRGMKRVKEFSWNNMALEYLKLYEEVYSKL